MNSLLARFFGHRDRELPAALEHHANLKKRFDMRRPVQDADFVAFDTELTGLDFKRDSIISIGAVKLRGGSIYPARGFYRLVKPEAELKRRSVVIHEITPSDLAGAEDQVDVLEEFIGFIGDAVLIGHFVHIDMNFVNRAMKKQYGLTLQNPAADTAGLHDWLYENDSRFARHYRGMTSKSDLFSMAKKYGIPVAKAHNAFSDAYVTAQLFQRFLYFLPACGITTVRELLMVGKP